MTLCHVARPAHHSTLLLSADKKVIRESRAPLSQQRWPRDGVFVTCILSRGGWWRCWWRSHCLGCMLLHFSRPIYYYYPVPGAREGPTKYSFFNRVRQRARSSDQRAVSPRAHQRQRSPTWTLGGPRSEGAFSDFASFFVMCGMWHVGLGWVWTWVWRGLREGPSVSVYFDPRF